VPEDQPVLNTLAEITAVSVARRTLDAREHMLARLAALVAMDAPATSYVLNVEPSAEVGLTVEDVQGLLLRLPQLSVLHEWCQRLGRSPMLSAL
jgi:hypothetical protein